MPQTRRGCLIKNSIRSMQKQRKRGKKQRFGEFSMRLNLGTKEFRAESGPCDRTHEGKSRAQQTTVEKTNKKKEKRSFSTSISLKFSLIGKGVL